MNKKQIKEILLNHSDDGVFKTRKALNQAVSGIYDMHLKDSGKESRKRDNLADPSETYHPNEKMNEAIQGFISARKDNRKPMTKNAAEAMLQRFKKGNFTIGECIEALEAAIIGNYQGVFPKKKFGERDRKVDHDGSGETDYTEGL